MVSLYQEYSGVCGRVREAQRSHQGKGEQRAKATLTLVRFALETVSLIDLCKGSVLSTSMCEASSHVVIESMANGEYMRVYPRRATQHDLMRMDYSPSWHLFARQYILGTAGGCVGGCEVRSALTGHEPGFGAFMNRRRRHVGMRLTR